MSGFWTNRRAAVAAEEQAEAQAQVARAQAETEAALAERSDEELLAELGLPEPETLVGGEELRRFLAAQLPQRLKRRALRALWRSNPVLACLDGLNDYEDDFTDAAVVKDGIATLYQVGRGFAERVVEVAEKLPEPEPEIEDEPILPEPPVQTAALPEFEPVEDDALAPPRLRRMTFQFDTEGTA
ncbi:DUF3306 domain-containing protein [Salipiger sp. 1_MG-2023]|uniref:DUF3306 domain-containing protein n=1 Tax=Salipiger sp. 1_MG-2023 TaxID=3062665 RepID=UPI0026E21A1A|nr:DUF3306 domain-containing protein [Salipiger sp. 1_MG-2023]MDO6584692.1 DUF3306 domain-containing protein [Salipiger sp. 1_MG-2023]